MNTKRAGLIFILAITLVLAGLFARAQQGVLACGDKLIVHLVRTIDFTPQGVTFPISMAVDNDRNSYIVDGTAENPRVLKYDKHGNFLLEWGGRGSGPGQFELWPQNPEDGPNAGFVAVDSQGYVYVSDAYNLRVQKFNSHGDFIMQFGEPGTGDGQFDPPTAGPLYVDKQDHIWVSTFPRVQKFDSQGNFLASYGSEGTGPGQFMGAGLGAIDNHGNMYIVDLFNARVQKLDANGQFLMAWGSPGTGEGQFFMPVGIVLDNSGRLFVTDNTNRVQVFTTKGRYLGQWSEPGHGYPPFTPLSGIAIDRKGDIYIEDIAVYVFRISP